MSHEQKLAILRYLMKLLDVAGKCRHEERVLRQLPELSQLEKTVEDMSNSRNQMYRIMWELEYFIRNVMKEVPPPRPQEMYRMQTS